MAQLNLKIDDVKEMERFISILCLGLIESIKRKVMSINEATHFFISPYSAQILKEKGVDEKLVTIIHLLCELKNVERIIPDKLGESIDDANEKLINYLNSLPSPELPQEYWIENL